MLQPSPSSAMLLTITKFLSMKTAFWGRKLSQIILFWLCSSDSGGQCYGCQQLPAAACDAGVWIFSGTAPHHLPGPWEASLPFTKDIPQNEDNSGRQPQGRLESSLHLPFLTIRLASDLLLPQAVAISQRYDFRHRFKSFSFTLTGWFFTLGQLLVTK